MQGWPGWVVWLNTNMVYPRTVTHLSTNPARRRVTSLMYPTTLPLSQTATSVKRKHKPTISVSERITSSSSSLPDNVSVVTHATLRDPINPVPTDIVEMILEWTTDSNVISTDIKVHVKNDIKPELKVGPGHTLDLPGLYWASCFSTCKSHKLSRRIHSNTPFSDPKINNSGLSPVPTTLSTSPLRLSLICLVYTGPLTSAHVNHTKYHPELSWPNLTIFRAKIKKLGSLLSSPNHPRRLALQIVGETGFFLGPI